MKTQEEIEQLAKQLCNIPIDLVIDEEERYYKNLEKYDGIIQGYTQCQEDNDWTKGCECENSIGQTWCCNQCGLPYDTRRKSDKIYTEEDLHTILRLRKEWYSHTDKNVVRDFIQSLNKQD